MTTRELFEQKFGRPPEGAVMFTSPTGSFAGYGYSLLNGVGNQREIRDYDNKWIGFQAGYEASITIGRKCAWTCDEYEDAWDTGCGNLFSFIDGSPEENKFKYCCYCGGNLTENKEGK